MHKLGFILCEAPPPSLWAGGRVRRSRGIGRVVMWVIIELIEDVPRAAAVQLELAVGVPLNGAGAERAHRRIVAQPHPRVHITGFSRAIQVIQVIRVIRVIQVIVTDQA